MNINSDNFITIQGWMRTELNLTGTELLVYAVIYGFSQDGVNKFTGSRQYLADWCGCSVRNIQLVLNTLTDKKFIVKSEREVNGIKVCDYAVDFTTSEIISPPSEKSSPNNIDNTKEINIVSKDTTVKKNLYEQCIDEIENNFRDSDIKNALVTYLSVRIKAGRLSAKSFRTIILKINDLADTKQQALDIIENATVKGYMSLYPVNTYRKNVYRDNINKVPLDNEDILRQRYFEEMEGKLPEEKINFNEWREKQ